MPLFRSPLPCPGKGGMKQKKKRRKARWVEMQAEGRTPSLATLCLWNLVENMKDFWTRDYAENYMDQYSFRYIMGPFNVLPGELVEDLFSLLSSHHMVTRSALHLLLVPQVRCLSLSSCSTLITPSICNLIGIRCQALLSLDLSGAQHLSALVLSELLGQLARLHSICLVGTQCDDQVLRTISGSCPALQHLDVSCCHQLAPTSLLHLVACPSGHNVLSLRSLLALDIDFENRESHRLGVAVCLLLSMPSLEKVAIDGLGEACAIIKSQNFCELDSFTSQKGMPNLWELWHSQIQGEQAGTYERAAEKECRDEGIEGWLSENEDYYEEEDEQLNERDTDGKWNNKRRTRPHSNTLEELESDQQTEGAERASRGSLTLSLREAQGVSSSYVSALGVLCPDLCSLSLHCEEGLVGSLSAGLEQWKGQFFRLGLQFTGLLLDILPSVGVVGSTLHTLTLEGVRMDGDASFLLLLRSCPKLKTLLIHTEPPRINREEEEENNEQDVPELPRLPQLRSLSLKFLMEHQQKKPLMSWRSLKWPMMALLGSSPFLEKATMMAIPCSMDTVFQEVLDNCVGSPEDPSISPLWNLRHLSLAYCNISMETAARLVTHRNQLSTLDLSGCWNVSSENIVKLKRKATRRRYPLTIIWC
ncbi:hypothetical protein GN956_G19372 [Arapaima gigas]